MRPTVVSKRLLRLNKQWKGWRPQTMKLGKWGPKTHLQLLIIAKGAAKEKKIKILAIIYIYIDRYSYMLCLIYRERKLLREEQERCFTIKCWQHFCSKILKQFNSVYGDRWGRLKTISKEKMHREKDIHSAGRINMSLTSTVVSPQILSLLLCSSKQLHKQQHRNNKNQTASSQRCYFLVMKRKDPEFKIKIQSTRLQD